MSFPSSAWECVPAKLCFATSIPAATSGHPSSAANTPVGDCIPDRNDPPPQEPSNGVPPPKRRPPVVPKRRLGMRLAKRCFASLINPPDSRFIPRLKFAKPRLVTTRKNLTSPTLFPAFVRRTRLRRGASVFVRRGRLMSAVIARPRRNKRRRNNASPPDGLSPTAHAQSPLQPAEPSPPPVKSETRTREGWAKCRARTLSPPRVARVTVGAD